MESIRPHKELVIDNRKFEMFSRVISVAVSLQFVCLVLALVSVGGIFAADPQLELRKISSFLTENDQSNDVSRHLELIRSNGDAFGGAVVRRLLEIADGVDCTANTTIETIRDYLNLSESDRKLEALLRHVAGLHLSSCVPDYEHLLEEILLSLGVKRRRKFLGLLNHDLVERSRELNSRLVTDVRVLAEPGALINSTLPVLMSSNLPRGRPETGNKKVLTLRAIKSIAKTLSKACPKFHERASKLFDEIRELVSIASHDSPVFEILGSSTEFQDNVFRYKICEDILSARKSKKVVPRVKDILKAHKLQGLIQTRQKREIIASLVLFGFAVWFIVLLIAMWFSQTETKPEVHFVFVDWNKVH